MKMLKPLLYLIKDKTQGYRASVDTAIDYRVLRHLHTTQIQLSAHSTTTTSSSTASPSIQHLNSFGV